MPKYSISAPYWDGQQYHKTGAVVEFAEGEAPPRSKLVKETPPAKTEAELAAEAAAAKAEAEAKEAAEAEAAKAAAAAAAVPKTATAKPAK